MRKITSLTLLIAGIIELITSIVLYIIPSGRVAYWADYHLLGLSKTQWGDIHITVGTLLLILVALHVYYNWRPITAYLKNKSKQLTVFNKNFNIALLISIYFTLGTIYSLPPMNLIINLGEHITDLGNKKYGEPPYGHAELSSLKMFCDKMNISLEHAAEALKGANINYSGTKDSMAEIAKNNNKTPQAIYEIIKPAIPSRNGILSFPESPSPNFGNKSLREICKTYDLQEQEVLAELKQAGFKAELNNSVKEIGANNNTNPMRIFETLKEIADKDKP